MLRIYVAARVCQVLRRDSPSGTRARQAVPLRASAPEHAAAFGYGVRKHDYADNQQGNPQAEVGPFVCLCDSGQNYQPGATPLISRRNCITIFVRAKSALVPVLTHGRPGGSVDNSDVLIVADARAVAKVASQVIAAEARAAIDSLGSFKMAVSGGRTPWQMLRLLAAEELPWDGVHVFQVDERVAPAGDPDRNLTHLRESLLRNAPLPPENVHAMPVENADLEAAVRDYERTLERLAGTPPVLDLVQLGLGADGHTASLIPMDPVLEIDGSTVALTGVYEKRRRMTLTYPVLNRARCILWVVTGAEKAEMFHRLLEGDASIPAGRIRRARTTVVADAAAAAA
jgi:6-phosphogluconolactonase